MIPKLMAAQKITFILTVGTSNLTVPLFPTFKFGNLSMYVILILLLLLLITVLLVALKDNKYVFRKHNWQDSPFNMLLPVSVFQFYAYLFLSMGIGSILSTLYLYNTINHIGLLAVTLGFGLIISLRITLLFINKRLSLH